MVTVQEEPQIPNRVPSLRVMVIVFSGNKAAARQYMTKLRNLHTDARFLQLLNNNYEHSQLDTGEYGAPFQYNPRVQDVHVMSVKPAEELMALHAEAEARLHAGYRPTKAAIDVNSPKWQQQGLSVLTHLLINPVVSLCFKRFLQAEYGKRVGAHIWEGLVGRPHYSDVDEEAEFEELIEGPSHATMAWDERGEHTSKTKQELRILVAMTALPNFVRKSECGRTMPLPKRLRPHVQKYLGAKNAKEDTGSQLRSSVYSASGRDQGHAAATPASQAGFVAAIELRGGGDGHGGPGHHAR